MRNVRIRVAEECSNGFTSTQPSFFLPPGEYDADITSDGFAAVKLPHMTFGVYNGDYEIIE
jgi:hypothetical protein